LQLLAKGKGDFLMLVTIFRQKGNTLVYISVQLDVSKTFIQIIS